MNDEKQQFTKEDAKWAKLTSEARDIVAVINQHGVTEFQKLKIIELLGLELENRESMLSITKAAKDAIENLRPETTNNRRIIQ